MQGRERFACSAHREKGSCTNNRMVAADRVERRVLDGVRDLLLTPEIVEAAMRAYESKLAASTTAALRTHANLEGELSNVKRRIDLALDLYERETINLETFKVRMEGLESKRDELVAKLRDCEPPASFTIHPRAIDHYRTLVDQLHVVLAEDDAQGVREGFQGLLDKVVFTPASERGEFDLELVGRLAALMSRDKNTLTGVTRKGAFVVGAGTGFEPVTFRL